MKIYSIYKSTAVAALMIISAPAVAQNNSPAAQEVLKEKQLWFHSKNAAGTAFDETRTYSNVNVGYDIVSGNFKRPQQGEKDKTLNISSEGFVDLGNAFVWGEFSFKHQNLTDAGYNASIADPFRGMPYYVVDTNLSNWRNQFYHLKFRAATPLLWNHVAFGMEGTYESSLSAKQRDVRTDTRCYKLELIPAVTYAINDQHRLGLAIEYTNTKEDPREDNVNIYYDQDYYTLYGLGMASHGIGSGYVLNYYGHRWGGSLEYNLNVDQWKLLIEGSYSKHVENVDNSFSVPRKLGAINDKVLAVNAELRYEGDALTHIFDGGWQKRDIDGIQYLNQRDNSSNHPSWVDLNHSIRSTYSTNTIHAHYGIMGNRGEEYDWRVDASLNYVSSDDEYILPKSTKDSKNLFIDLEAKKNFKVGDKLNNRLLVGVNGGLRNANDGKYEYHGTHQDYPTIAMEAADEAYLTSDGWHVGGSLTYSQQLKENQKLNVFLKAAFDYHKSKADAFDKRSYASCTLGFNF